MAVDGAGRREDCRTTTPLLDGGWTPRAVVFDCDGLLVDTEDCWARAEAELFARRGRMLTDAENDELIGMSAPETPPCLATRLGEGGDEGALGAELLAIVGRVVARDARALPGAHAIVDRA